jgi:hypothetical protein
VKRLCTKITAPEDKFWCVEDATERNGYQEIERELSDIFGRKVDLDTPAFISRHFRDQVLAEAETVYATGVRMLWG